MIDLSNSEVVENNYGVIPAGEYPAIVEKCEWKASYEGDREELNYQLRIIGDKYNNRVLFKKFDVKNTDENASKKAVTSLKRMVTLFGIETNNFDEFSVVNKNINIVVSVYTTSKNEEKNSIYYFKAFKAPEKNIDILKSLKSTHDIKTDSSFSSDSIPF